MKTFNRGQNNKHQPGFIMPAPQLEMLATGHVVLGTRAQQKPALAWKTSVCRKERQKEEKKNSPDIMQEPDRNIFPARTCSFDPSENSVFDRWYAPKHRITSHGVTAARRIIFFSLPSKDLASSPRRLPPSIFHTLKPAVPLPCAALIMPWVKVSPVPAWWLPQGKQDALCLALGGIVQPLRHN